MLDFFTVFIIQMVFIFLIDNKYRILNKEDIREGLVFQALIAMMYVLAIPLVAKGTVLTAIGYITGSVLGTYLSFKWHERRSNK